MNRPVLLTPPRRREARFSAEQYYAIADTGVLDELGRTELIHGRIEVVSPQHRPHMEAKMALSAVLFEAVKGRSDLKVGGEGSVEFGRRNVPEPDLFLYTPTTAPRAVPSDAVRLIIEVAETSEARDLGLKQRLYARHNVPEYWVAVLRNRTVERFADPQDGRYARHDSFGFDEAITSVTLPFVTVPAGTLPA